jgi:hypothetical protein
LVNLSSDALLKHPDNDTGDVEWVDEVKYNDKQLVNELLIKG